MHTAQTPDTDSVPLSLVPEAGASHAAVVVALDEASVDAVARRVVELLAGHAPRRGLVTAAQLAKRLGVDRSYVYAHADELGVRRLGSGPQPRLRFDIEEAEAAYTCLSTRGAGQAVSPVRKPKIGRPRGSSQASVPALLPVRGVPTFPEPSERAA